MPDDAIRELEAYLQRLYADKFALENSDDLCYINGKMQPIDAEIRKAINVINTIKNGDDK